MKKIAFFELCLLHEFWAEVSVDVTASSSSSCLSMTHHPTPMAHHPNSTNNSQQNAQASPSHPRHPEGTGPDYPIPLVDLDKIHSPRQGKQIRTTRSFKRPFKTAVLKNGGRSNLPTPASRAKRSSLVKNQHLIIGERNITPKSTNGVLQQQECSIK